MTSWVVADSGIFLAAVLAETHTARAKALLHLWDEQSIQIGAPILLRYEIVAVMRKCAHRGTLSAEEAARGRDFLLEYPVRLTMDDDLLRRAYDLATRFNQPTAYDSQYLAVAEHVGCEFWTADERLFNTLKDDLAWVRWLGNFTG